MEKPKYEKENYENFFRDGGDIVEKYPRKKENKYNVFSMLNQEYKEEMCHSRVIFNLINDCESNRLEKRFLKFFFEKVLETEFDESKKYFVEREKNLGEYGRADLFIEDSEERAYLIEMKINAGDQPKQLSRYNRYLKKNYKDNYEIYYLTLSGYNPSNYSLKGRVEVEYNKISFVDNIYNWIKKCIEELGENNKILKINLEQYLETLTKITNRIGEEQKMKFIEMMKEGKNFRVAEEIASNFEEIKKGLRERFFYELRDYLKEELKIESEENERYYKVYSYSEYTEFYFYKSSTEIKDKERWCYGLGVNTEGEFYLTVSLLSNIEELEGKKITNKILKEKLRKIVNYDDENIDSGVTYYEEYFENIPVTEFNIMKENFYIIVNEEEKEKKDKLMSKIKDYFMEKYNLIKEL